MRKKTHLSYDVPFSKAFLLKLKKMSILKENAKHNDPQIYLSYGNVKLGEFLLKD